MPAITVAFLFRAILAFKAFDEVFLLTGGGPGTSSELLSLHLYKVFFEQNQLGYGAMLSVFTIVGVLMLLAAARTAAKRVGAVNATITAKGPAPSMRRRDSALWTPAVRARAGGWVLIGSRDRAGRRAVPVDPHELVQDPDCHPVGSVDLHADAGKL